MFVGTSHSTFSGFVARLRGYMDAPDKGVYVATDKWKAPMQRSDWVAKGPQLSGNNFYGEWYVMWEGLD